MEWWLYLIRDNQNRLYTGITTDVIRRFRQHQKGTGAKNLRGKGPLHLHCCFLIGSKQIAAQLEYQIKQWPKQRKELLVNHPEWIDAWLESRANSN